VKLIILDRDGVINEDSDAFIKSVDEWIPIPGSIEAMARLYHAGYTLAIATNQSGIARGYYDVVMLDAMHTKMRYLLATLGAEVAYIAYCPHLSSDHCDCRKPKPGMLLTIAKHFGIAPAQAHVVGDSLRDWQAAAALGASYAQVRTGKGLRTLAEGKLPADIPVFANLADYADSLLGITPA
jgi:D-glycero-D-manno-heptose 1,7-bisphosphate phosphatase